MKSKLPVYIISYIVAIALIISLKLVLPVYGFDLAEQETLPSEMLDFENTDYRLIGDGSIENPILIESVQQLAELALWYNTSLPEGIPPVGSELNISIINDLNFEGVEWIAFGETNMVIPYIHINGNGNTIFLWGQTLYYGTNVTIENLDIKDYPNIAEDTIVNDTQPVEIFNSNEQISQNAYEILILEGLEYYKVYTAYELEDIRKKIAAKEFDEYGNSYANGNYILMDDIYLSGIWTPISSNFTGKFNGNHKFISGLTIDSTSNNQGLFSNLNSSNIEIVNLELKNCNIKGQYYVGGIAGYLTKGKITGCIVSGTISCTAMNVGGIVGVNEGGTIEKCINTGTIISSTKNSGGIAGQNKNIISNCQNEGTVSGKSNVGGIVGNNVSSISNCVNNGVITNITDRADDFGDTGGIAGYHEYSASISNCINIGTVNGSGKHIGGIAGGALAGSVTNCVALSYSISGRANVYRISSNDGAYSNNIAWAGMKLVIGNIEQLVSDGAYNGIGKDKNGLLQRELWDTLFQQGIWFYSENREVEPLPVLPVFGGSHALPDWIMIDVDIGGNVIEDKEYDGSAVSYNMYNIEIKKNDENIPIEISKLNVQFSQNIDGIYTNIAEAPVYAGVYRLTVSLLPDIIYTGSKDFDFIITKRGISVDTDNTTALVKTFDGENKAIIERVEFVGLVDNDNFYFGNDYTVKSALYDDANAGFNKKVSAIVVLETNETTKNYELKNEVFSIENQTIIKADKESKDVVFEVTNKYAHEYSYDLSELLLDKELSVNVLSYIVTSETNNSIFSSNPTIYKNVISLPVKNVQDSDISEYITIEFNSLNYNIATATLTVKVVGKTDVEINGDIITGYIYSGEEISKYISNVTITREIDEEPVPLESVNIVSQLSKKNGNGLYEHFEGNPKDAGEYKLILSVADDSAYAGSKDFEFIIMKKQIEIDVNNTIVEPKTYDGSKNVIIKKVGFNGLVLNETLSLNTDYSLMSAEYNDASAGFGKAITATIMLKETKTSDNYELKSNKLELAGKNIAKASAIAKSDTLEVIKGYANKYEYDLKRLLPEMIGINEIYYKITSVTDNSILADNPSIDGDKIIIPVKRVENTGVTETINIGFDSQNYNITDALLTVKTVDKDLVDINCDIITNHIYNGEEITDYVSNITVTRKIENETILLESVNIDAQLSKKNSNELYEYFEGNPKDAGEYKLTLSVADDTAYTGSKDFEFTIKKKQIEIDVNSTIVEPKIYDGDKNATIHKVGFTGLVLNETLLPDTDYSVSSAEYNNADAGFEKIITATIVLNETKTADNYELKSDKLELTGKSISKAIATTKNDTIEATKGYANKYEYDLKNLLPEMIGINEIYYKITSVTDNSILADNPTIEGDKIIISVKEVENTEFTEIIKIGFDSRNYNITDAMLTIKAVDKEFVEINGNIITGHIYNGEEITDYISNVSITRKTDKEALPLESVNIDAQLSKKNRSGLYEHFEGNPKDAGEYKLTLSVDDGAAYTGSKDFEFTIMKKQIEIDVSSTIVEPKIYDGDKNATIHKVGFTGLVLNETLLPDTDYSVSSAEYNNADAGFEKIITATIALNETKTADNYELKSNKLEITGKSISKAIATAKNDTIEATKGYANKYEYDLKNLLPEMIGINEIYYKITSETDNTILADNPTIDGDKIIIPVKRVENTGVTETINIGFDSQNYNITDALLTVKTVDKDLVDINCDIIANHIYNGEEITDYISNITVTRKIENETILLESVNIDAQLSKKNNNGLYEHFEGNPKDAGEYKLMLSVADDSAYAGSKDFEFTIMKKQIEIDVSSTIVESKIYDGDKNAIVHNVGFTGLVLNETLLLNTDYSVISAKYDDAGAGFEKTIIAAITLNETKTSDNYELKSNKLEITGKSISKASAVAKSDTVEVIKGYANKYEYDLKHLLPEMIGISEIYYKITSATDNTILADNPIIDGDKIVIPVKKVENTGIIEIIKIEFESQNYDITDAILTVKTVDKELVEISGDIITDHIYNGEEITNYLNNMTITRKTDKESIPLESVNIVAQLSKKNSNGLYEYFGGNPKYAGEYKYTLSVADDEIYAGSEDFDFTIMKKQIEIDVNNTIVEPKTYDGDKGATIQNISFIGLVLNETLLPDIDYSVLSAEYNNADAGFGKMITATIMLNETKTSNNYELKSNKLEITGKSISKASAVAKSDMVEVTKGYANKYEYNLSSLLPEMLNISEINKYKITSITNNTVLSENPTIDGDKIIIPVKKVENTGVTEIIKIEFESLNYDITDALLTVKTIDKDLVEIKGDIITNHIYNGEEITNYISNVTVSIKNNKESVPLESVNITAQISKKNSNGLYEYFECNPKDAGEYKLILTIADDEIYAGSKDFEFTIMKKQIEIDANNTILETKTYDGTKNATIHKIGFNELVAGEELNIGVDYIILSAEFDTANAGENKTVTATVMLKDTIKSNNYVLANDDLVISYQNINKAVIVVENAKIKQKTFDNTNKAIVEEIAFSGLQNGDQFMLNTDYIAVGEYSDYNAGEGKIVTITLTLIGEKSENYYIIQDTFSIDDRSISPKVEVGQNQVFEVQRVKQTYYYDLNNLLPNTLINQYKDLIIYEIGNVNNESGLLIDIPQNSDISEGLLKITVADSLADDSTATIEIKHISSNYSITNSELIVKAVGKIPVIISFNIESGEYNGKIFEVSEPPVFKQIADGTSVLPDYETTYYKITEYGKIISITENPKDIGRYRAEIKVKDLDTIYTGSLSKDFEITPRLITIRAEDKTALTGSTIPEFTYVVDGLIEGEPVNIAFVGKPLLKSPTANMALAGKYSIIVDMNDIIPLGNYAFDTPHTKNAILTVIKATSDDSVKENTNNAANDVIETSVENVENDINISINGVSIDISDIIKTDGSYIINTIPQNGAIIATIPATVFTHIANREKSISDIFIEIVTPNATYKIPLNLVDFINGFDNILTEGIIKGEDYSFNIKITEMNYEEIQQALKNVELIGYPIDFVLEVIDNKTGNIIKEISEFTSEIEREIALFEDINEMPVYFCVARINADTGALEFVPHNIITRDGRIYVVISSKTNSIYIVAKNHITYPDVPEDYWGKATIELAASKLLVSHMGNGLFEPQKQVTRAQFVQMVTNALQLPSANEKIKPYTDVIKGTWYYNAITKAKSVGVLSSFDTEEFKPNEPITREEMACIIASAAKYIGINTSQNINISTKYSDFEYIDTKNVSAVNTVVNLKIMQGMSDSIFAPKNKATRAQAAVVLINMMKTFGYIK